MSINLVKKKNREGLNYVYLVEAFREGKIVRHRHIQSFGQLEKLEAAEPGWFERMKIEVKKDGYVQEKKKELIFRFNTELPLDTLSQNYGWKILDALFDTLKLSDVTQQKRRDKINLTQVLKLLVYQRILFPASKLATLAHQSELYGNWKVSENEAYRSLSLLETLSNEIQLQAHRAISDTIGRTATLVFYDVTNYYFETDGDDEFRKRGPSKEHRPQPIVQMGLFMDSKGIPISYRLFRGNQTDPITYLPAIEQVKKQFGLERVIVVADKAMNSKNNVLNTYHNGDGWLFSQKHRGIRGASKEIQNFILSPENWEVNAKGNFAHKSMIRERLLSKGVSVKEKVLVTWNKAYAEREKARRDSALDYAKKLTNAELFRQSAKRGGKKYLELKLLDKTTGEVKDFNPLIQLNEDLIQFDAQFDGINVLVTSEVGMTDEEMIRHYGELYKIEDCFRVTKSEFEARPVYVWTEAHIKAHFLTCFLALVLLRLLQNLSGWQMSSSRLVEALRSARTIAFPQSYELVEGNEDFRLLNEWLQLDWKKRFVETEQGVKHFFRDKKRS
jgi:transposase